MGSIGGSPGSVSVPAGAATAVKQDTGNTSLASIDAKLTDNSQKTQIVDSTGDSADVVDLGTQLVSGDSGIVTNTVIHGKTTAGGGSYIDVKVTPSGALSIEGEITANAGTNLNTSALALDATLTNKTQFTKITDGTDTALVTTAGEMNVIATAQPGVDIGDVTINNAAGGSAVNIQDGGNSITVDGTVTATYSKSAQTPSSPTFATVGTSSAQAVAANASRKGLILINDSIYKIYLGLGATAVIGSGILIYPGGVAMMTADWFTTGAINAIATGASSNLCVQELI